MVEYVQFYLSTNIQYLNIVYGRYNNINKI